MQKGSMIGLWTEGSGMEQQDWAALTHMLFQMLQSDTACEPWPVEALRAWKMLEQWVMHRLRSGPARGWQPADWQDMTQEVLVKVSTHVAAERVDIQGFPQWLNEVIQTVAYDYVRKVIGRGREKRRIVPLQEEHLGADERQEAEFLAMLARCDCPVLLIAIATLKPRERTVIVLTFWYDYSLRKIAAILNIRDHKIIEKALDRAYTKLRKWLRAI